MAVKDVNEYLNTNDIKSCHGKLTENGSFTDKTRPAVFNGRCPTEDRECAANTDVHVES